MRCAALRRSRWCGPQTHATMSPTVTSSAAIMSSCPLLRRRSLAQPDGQVLRCASSKNGMLIDTCIHCILISIPIFLTCAAIVPFFGSAVALEAGGMLHFTLTSPQHGGRRLTYQSVIGARSSAPRSAAPRLPCSPPPPPESVGCGSPRVTHPALSRAPQSFSTGRRPRSVNHSQRPSFRPCQ